jgi:hypothetical protein
MIGLEELFGQPETPKMASPKDVANACETLIQHVLGMGCDSAVINVGSEEGGRAVVTVKVIDCSCSED